MQNTNFFMSLEHLQKNWTSTSPPEMLSKYQNPEIK